MGLFKAIDWEEKSADILVEEEFRGALDEPEESETGLISRH